MENQDAVIKQSLIINAFSKYHEFVNFLKSIPINQNNMLAQEAFKFIDIGMICFEKFVTQCPLIAVGEPNPTAIETPIETAPEITEDKN